MQLKRNYCNLQLYYSNYGLPARHLPGFFSFLGARDGGAGGGGASKAGPVRRRSTSLPAAVCGQSCAVPELRPSLACGASAMDGRPQFGVGQGWPGGRVLAMDGLP